METWVIAAGLVVLAVILIGLIRSSRRPPVAVAAPRDEFVDGVVSDPVPVEARRAATEPSYVPSPSVMGASAAVAGDAPVPSAPSEPRRMRWSRQFDPPGGTLSDEARLRLIGDLGLVHADWSDAILEQALLEEMDPVYLSAAHAALGRVG